MEIKNRVLELSNKDFYNILNNKGNKVLDKLEEELKKNNYSFNDFSEIKLDGSQLRHRKYIELYSEIICEFWNKKDFKLKSDEEILISIRQGNEQLWLKYLKMIVNGVNNT